MQKREKVSKYIVQDCSQICYSEKDFFASQKSFLDVLTHCQQKQNIQDRIFIIKLNIYQDQNVNLPKHDKLNNIKLN